MSLSGDKEQQGINVIDSAIKNKVSHLVFSGLENVESVTGKNCTHFDNKEKIEAVLSFINGNKDIILLQLF